MGQKIRRRHMRHKSYARASRGSGRSRYLLDYCSDEAGNLGTAEAIPGGGATQVVVRNTTPDPDVLSITGFGNHGLVDGDGPFYFSSTGTIIGPFLANTPYFAQVVDNNEFRMSPRQRQPQLAGLEPTDSGSGNTSIARGNDQQAVFFLLAKSGVGPTEIEAATNAEDL